MNNTALLLLVFFFFFQAEDGIRDLTVTGVQTCALPIFAPAGRFRLWRADLDVATTAQISAPKAKTASRREALVHFISADPAKRPIMKIGRASCRERV